MNLRNVLNFAFSILFVMFFTSLLTSQSIVVKVYPHIIRDDDGTGGITNAQLNESKDLLNGIYNPFDIYFEYECTNYIYDSDIAQDPGSSLCPGLESYGHRDGVDIFIGNDEGAAGGQADKVPGSSFGLGGTYPPSCTLWPTPSHPGGSPLPARKSGVLAHEMGHVLGLLHTFESGISSTNLCGTSYYNSCEEYVDGIGGNCLGPNCDTCGDKVCDTSADENEEADYDPCDCSSISNYTDDCDDLKVPDGHNIMSYAPPHCGTVLTPGQADRIKTIMTNSPLLTVSGSADLCEATFCCDLENRTICIMDDQCDSFFSDHCQTCTVEWILPVSGGTNSCIQIMEDTSFIYRAVVYETINGDIYSTVIEGTFADFCGPNVTTTAMASSKVDTELYIYPIPAYDELYVANESEDEFIFELYTFDGSLIVNQKLTPDSKINLFDFQFLSKGIYFARYYTLDNTIIKTERILVM